MTGQPARARWWAGLTVDHLYEDCPNRVKAEKSLRRCEWWETGGDNIDPDGGLVCGMCLHRRRGRAT